LITAIICGGRNWDDAQATFQILDQIDKEYGIGTVISGGARGADNLAEAWAHARNKQLKVFPAQWTLHGKAAGFIRNDQMLRDGEPDLVIAFPGGSGTGHMTKNAIKKGVKTLSISIAHQGFTEYSQEGDLLGQNFLNHKFSPFCFTSDAE
jgi:hypothetical protein